MNVPCVSLQEYPVRKHVLPADGRGGAPGTLTHATEAWWDVHGGEWVWADVVGGVNNGPVREVKEWGAGGGGGGGERRLLGVGKLQ